MSENLENAVPKKIREICDLLPSDYKIVSIINNPNGSITYNVEPIIVDDIKYVEPLLPNDQERLIPDDDKDFLIEKSVLYRGLKKLPTLHEGLEELDCSDCLLTILPPLPSTLKVLRCSGNKLKKLPKLPLTLEILDCSSGFSESFNIGYMGYRHKPSNYNKIRELPELPPKLEELYCSGNKLVNLPDLPNSLKKLFCSNNQLENLPDLPNSLKILSCYNNLIISLPKLSLKLLELSCCDNLLTKLPDLPNNLKKLFCDNNKLKILPYLPDNLLYGNNFLDEDDIHESFSCYDNLLPITELKDKITFYNEYFSKIRMIERCKIIKEDLMKEMWRPERVQKIAKLGEEYFDTYCTC